MSQSAKELALKYVARRMRTEEEVRRHLVGKKILAEDIEEAITWLKGYQYLDDNQYAELFIRDKSRFTPYGRYKLYDAMRRKGLSRGCIEEAIRAHFPPEMEGSLASQLAQKQKERGREKIQIMRYLKGRGFSGAAIRQAVSKTLEDDWESS